MCRDWTIQSTVTWAMCLDAVMDKLGREKSEEEGEGIEKGTVSFWWSHWWVWLPCSCKAFLRNNLMWTVWVSAMCFIFNSVMYYESQVQDRGECVFIKISMNKGFSDTWSCQHDVTHFYPFCKSPRPLCEVHTAAVCIGRQWLLACIIADYKVYPRDDTRSWCFIYMTQCLLS